MPQQYHPVTLAYLCVFVISQSTAVALQASAYQLHDTCTSLTQVTSHAGQAASKHIHSAHTAVAVTEHTATAQMICMLRTVRTTEGHQHHVILLSGC